MVHSLRRSNLSGFLFIYLLRLLSLPFETFMIYHEVERRIHSEYWGFLFVTNQYSASLVHCDLPDCFLFETYYT